MQPHRNNIENCTEPAIVGKEIESLWRNRCEIRVEIPSPLADEAVAFEVMNANSRLRSITGKMLLFNRIRISVGKLFEDRPLKGAVKGLHSTLHFV